MKRLSTKKYLSFQGQARKHKKITWKGQTLTIKEWAERIGLSYAGLLDRLAKGIPLDRALTAPKGTHFFPEARKPRIALTYRGETMSMTQWAKRIGMDLSTVFRRWQKGLPMEEVLSGTRRKPNYPRSAP